MKVPAIRFSYENIINSWVTTSSKFLLYGFIYILLLRLITYVNFSEGFRSTVQFGEQISRSFIVKDGFSLSGFPKSSPNRTEWLLSLEIHVYICY